MDIILPKSLELAARSNADPRWGGEIVLALVNGEEKRRLDIGQRTVLAMCRQELADRDAKRAAWAARKRKSRAGGAR